MLNGSGQDRGVLRGLFGALSWTIRNLVGGLLIVSGLAAAPDNLAKLVVWYDRVGGHSVVKEHVKTVISAFEKSYPVPQMALAIAGLLLLIWPLRWFWRLRNKIKFRLRRVMSDQVWISHNDALTLIRNSSWGQLKAPRIESDWFAPASFRTGTGLTPKQKATRKFNHFLRLTLDSFCANNPSACRQTSEDREIEETALRRFLDRAMDEEVTDDFGRPPNFTVKGG